MARVMAVAILAVALVAVAASAFAQSGRPITAADLFALHEIGEIQLSPDGSRIAFTETLTDLGPNSAATRLMTMPASGGQPTVAKAPVGVSSLRWSPDGRKLAFIAPRQDAAQGAELRVWTLDLVSSALTDVCAYDRGNSFISKAGNSLAWSPDGTRLAFVGTNEPRPAAADPLVITRIQYKGRTAFSDNRRSHIFAVLAAGGTPQAVTRGPHDEHSIAWGGDGSEIVFLSNRERDPDVNLNYDIFAVKIPSGEVRRLTDTPGVEMDPRVSPDGRHVAYVATTRSITTIDSVAEDAHLFVIDSRGGQPRELNHALDRRTSAPEWAPDSKAVLFTAADHGKTILYRVPLEGGASVALVDRKAQVGPYAISGKDGTVVFGLTDPLTPREIFRLRPADTEPKPLTTLNAAIVRGWKLVSPETIAYKSVDGTAVEGWLYPALGAGVKAPMILTIHGGPHGMYGYGFNASFQLNSARGYATLAINPRGSSGYGQTFADGCVNNWGGGDYKDLMAGVDYVARTHPGIDADRLGVMGGSYGGFMTNWVITQTQRFKAAVSSASVSNLISFYATSLYQDLVHAEFNGFPWDGDNFALLWKWSPLAHVKNVTTPTLFIHGELDNDVHITQAEEMFTALRRRGVEAVLARYPREGHGFREPRHQMDRTTRALEWMDRHVKKPPVTTSGRQ